LKTKFFQISDELFARLGKLVTETYGIKLPPEKKIMFQSRLQRRLHELQMDSFDQYASRLFDEQFAMEELGVIASYISTNKTEFFREKEHFDFLYDHIFPKIKEKSGGVFSTKTDIWSAGCSSGQEAYSIGIMLEEYKKSKGNSLEYGILATDISDRMLKVAKTAVYPMVQVSGIPIELKHRYFLKSKNPQDEKVRVVKEIRDRVRVAKLNLMDSFEALTTKFDIIFLRNTLIYFAAPVQVKVLEKVIDCLKIGGYLFIGHSESLINLTLPIRSVAPSVYIKTE